MALRACPDCGAEMSTGAMRCPNCGREMVGLSGTLFGMAIFFTVIVAALAAAMWLGWI